MSDRATRFSDNGELLERHVVKHWLVVNDDHGGSMFSVSSAQESNPVRARERAIYWLRPGYHIEVQEQVWWSTESDWVTVECDLEAPA